MALVLAFAPASFAGEDDPGPTQIGELQTPSTPPDLASTQLNSSSNNSSTSGKSKGTASKNVLAARTTKTLDTVAVQQGVQAGFGGMAAESATAATSLPAAFAFVGGGLLLLAAAAGLVPLHRRSQD